MRFWGKDRKQDNRKNIWIEHLNIDTGNWFQVFSACLGKMIAIQTACSEQVVKGQDWNVDFSEGVILFGNQKYPLQFIGSEATSSNTWLWGWENINGFSEKIIQVATHAKVVGERWNLEPLTTAEFTLDDTFNGHNLSIVTCGLVDKYCYYRGPHSGGAILVAFSGVPDSVFASIDVQKFVSITTQCIQQFHIDQKIFVEGFLSWNRSGKRTYYNPKLSLVNPYTDAPEDFLHDIGPLVMPIPGNDRAIVTEKVLKLNRSTLVERRTERIMMVEILLQSWAKEKNATIKDLLSDQLHDEYAEDKEFSSTVKSFLKANGFPVKDVS